MFKRLKQFVAVALFALICVLPGKVHASTQDFTISNFEADYYLSRNEAKTSLLNVKEKIVAEFPSYDQNHGILRSLPKSYQGHTVSLQVESVTDDSGTPYNYSTSTENGNEVLKIGDADKYVHGTTIYNINYSLKNVINFQKIDEFYWDVNGNQWYQPLAEVTGRLHVPSYLASELADQGTVCYTGYNQSSEQNCTVEKSSGTDEVVITSKATNLGARQNLTFVTGFKSGTFVLGPEIAQEKRRMIMIVLLVIAATLILPIITFIVCFRKWRRQGRDPKGKGIIIPEYVAPKNLNVMSSAYVLNQTFAPKAASAGIIELAVQKYLRINEIKKKKLIGTNTDYELEIVRDVSGVSKEQKMLLDGLFDSSLSIGSSMTVSVQKNKLYSTIKELNSHLASSLTAAGYFSSNPEKARGRFMGGAIGLFAVGCFLLILVPLGVGLVLSAIIAFIFSLIMPARTPQGVETMDYIKGLKEYIKLAEKDRLEYLQSPQGAEKVRIDSKDSKQMVKLFEDLLPYAVLFGLEKEWAEEFKDLYKQPPEWYNGNMNSFNAVYLANSLGSFSSANNAAFTAPSSSSSSGFGGGGFSGGGGGGGGGGGW